jgi:hypothetical protein
MGRPLGSKNSTTDAERRERLNASQRRYRKNHPERLREQDRLDYAKHPHRHKDVTRQTKLRVRYGITPECYEDMLAKQGGVCAICGGEPHRYRLAVDHDHKSGKVRSLLCSPCNTALGALENTAWRNLAEAYLERHK